MEEEEEEGKKKLSLDNILIISLTIVIITTLLLIYLEHITVLSTKDTIKLINYSWITTIIILIVIMIFNSIKYKYNDTRRICKNLLSFRKRK